MTNSYWNYTLSENELYHHGIMGQKWGVRKYQNKDGSLTPEGRIRYGQLRSNQRKSWNKGGAPERFRDNLAALYFSKNNRAKYANQRKENPEANVKNLAKFIGRDIGLNTLKSLPAGLVGAGVGILSANPLLGLYVSEIGVNLTSIGTNVYRGINQYKDVKAVTPKKR